MLTPMAKKKAPPCQICGTARWMVRFENPDRWECSNTEGHTRIRAVQTQQMAKAGHSRRKRR